MKRHISLFTVIAVCAALLCACGEQSVAPATTTTSTTSTVLTTTDTTASTHVTEKVTATTPTPKTTRSKTTAVPTTSRSTVAYTWIKPTASTTTVSTALSTTITTTSVAPTTTTTQNEQDKFPGVIVKAGIFSYAKHMPRVTATDVIPTEEFLQKYPIALPSGFSTWECRYRLPNGWGIQAGTPEDGYVKCEKEDGAGILHLYVGKTTYPYTNLYPPYGVQDSYANGIAVKVYQNTGDYGFMDVGEFMVTFQKEEYYYRLFATDMTLTELVAVLEELLGGEFSKTTRATTTTTPYISETYASTTTAVSQNG